MLSETKLQWNKLGKFSGFYCAREGCGGSCHQWNSFVLFCNSQHTRMASKMIGATNGKVTFHRGARRGWHWDTDVTRLLVVLLLPLFVSLCMPFGKNISSSLFEKDRSLKGCTLTTKSGQKRLFCSTLTIFAKIVGTNGGSQRSSWVCEKYLDTSVSDMSAACSFCTVWSSGNVDPFFAELYCRMF